MSTEAGRRYCGREFSEADLAHLRALLAELSLLGPDLSYFVGAPRGNPRKCVVLGRQKHL